MEIAFFSRDFFLYFLECSNLYLSTYYRSVVELIIEMFYSNLKFI